VTASPTINLLIAEDEEHLGLVLQKELSRLGNHVVLVHDGQAALEAAGETDFDVALIDIMMPKMTGIDLCHFLHESYPDTVIIVESAMTEIHYAIEALRHGAFDYITKPYTLAEVQAAVERALHHRLLLTSSKQYDRRLEELVSARTDEVHEASSTLSAALKSLALTKQSTLSALAVALETRDVDSPGHSERVVAYCKRLGIMLELGSVDMAALEQAALIHDIGKIAVPDSILMKKGPLNEQELVHMRRHVDFSLRIMRGMDLVDGTREIVAQHHERLDGGGYPKALSADKILIGARILAVADAFDAMTSERRYDSTRTFESAIDELRRCSGTQFDPRVVDALTRVPVDRWREIGHAATKMRAAAQDRDRIKAASLHAAETH